MLNFQLKVFVKGQPTHCQPVEERDIAIAQHEKKNAMGHMAMSG